MEFEYLRKEGETMLLDGDPEAGSESYQLPSPGNNSVINGVQLEGFSRDFDDQASSPVMSSPRKIKGKKRSETPRRLRDSAAERTPRSGTNERLLRQAWRTPRKSGGERTPRRPAHSARSARRKRSGGAERTSRPGSRAGVSRRIAHPPPLTSATLGALHSRKKLGAKNARRLRKPRARSAGATQRGRARGRRSAGQRPSEEYDHGVKRELPSIRIPDHEGFESDARSEAESTVASIS
eukprot:737855_1